MSSRRVLEPTTRPARKRRAGQSHEGRRMRWCAYCGARCYGLTCSGHRDLVRVDPNMEGR